MVANPTYTPVPEPAGGFKSFTQFYPFYLGEHSLPTTRRLHLVGTSLALTAFARATASLVPLAARQLAHVVSSIKIQSGILRWIADLLIDLATRTSSWSMDQPARWWLGGIVTAYAFAWTGHFFVEKNKPATFRYPLWSLRGDLKLWSEVITGQRAF